MENNKYTSFEDIIAHSCIAKIQYISYFVCLIISFFIIYIMPHDKTLFISLIIIIVLIAFIGGVIIPICILEYLLKKNGLE